MNYFFNLGITHAFWRYQADAYTIASTADDLCELDRGGPDSPDGWRGYYSSRSKVVQCRFQREKGPELNTLLQHCVPSTSCDVEEPKHSRRWFELHYLFVATNGNAIEIPPTDIIQDSMVLSLRADFTPVCCQVVVNNPIRVGNLADVLLATRHLEECSLRDFRRHYDEEWIARTQAYSEKSSREEREWAEALRIPPDLHIPIKAIDSSGNIGRGFFNVVNETATQMELEIRLFIFEDFNTREITELRRDVHTNYRGVSMSESILYWSRNDIASLDVAAPKM